VLNSFAIRRRLTRSNSRPYTLLLALAFAVSTSCVAHAFTFSAASDCGASGNSLSCHLLGFLNFLYAAAGILAFMLIMVVALAIKSYRKNKKDEKIDS
jgi:hypothetical protein